EGRVVALRHCDVKPSNMLVVGDTIKLADFGLSVESSSGIQFRRPVGTLNYAAPEVFLGQLTEHTDQYALALSYAQLRGVKLPYPPLSTFRNAWPKYRPLADLSRLTQQEQTILAKALSRLPRDRWPNCRGLLAELARFANESPHSGSR